MSSCSLRLYLGVAVWTCLLAGLFGGCAKARVVASKKVTNPNSAPGQPSTTAEQMLGARVGALYAQPLPSSEVQARREVALLMAYIRSQADKERPASHAKALGRHPSLCQVICRASKGICRSAHRICQIARRFPKTISFQRACHRAQGDCHRARRSCASCN